MIDRFASWADPHRLAALRALPKAADLVDLLRAPAQLRPEEVAVVVPQNGREPEALTWGDLWTGALREAARLREAGCAAGDRVLVMLPTGAAFFSAYFGAIAAGAMAVPVSPPQSLRRRHVEAHEELVRALIADSDAFACISDDEVMAVMGDGLRAGSAKLRVFRGAARGEPLDDREVAPVSAGATAMLQYTSGSTSRPKGVMLTHGNLLANADGVGRLLYHPEALKVSWLPLHHDMGLIGSLLTSLYWRVPLVMLQPSTFIRSPASWLRALSDWRASLTSAPNFAYALCVRKVGLEELDGVRLDAMRAALSGAEPVDPAVVLRFEEKFAPLGLRAGVVRPAYGLAESSLAVCVAEPSTRVVDEVSAAGLESEGRARPPQDGERRATLISVGRPLHGVDVRIADAAGTTCADRGIGEIIVRGPSVMAGYFRQPDATAAVLRDGWLHTGDLGYLDAGILRVSGRARELIIRQGRNFHPIDLERRAMELPGVFPSGAVAFDCHGSTVLVIETALRDEAARAELLRAVRASIRDAFLFNPDDVRAVAPGWIPRTTSGKVRRQECRLLYLAESAGEVHRPPQAR